MRFIPNDLTLVVGDDNWALLPPKATLNKPVQYILYGEGTAPTPEERQYAFQLFLEEFSQKPF